MSNVNVEGLLEEMDIALAEKDEIKSRMAGLRALLRHSRAAGEATEEQAARIEQLLPSRARQVAEAPPED